MSTYGYACGRPDDDAEGRALRLGLRSVYGSTPSHGLTGSILLKKYTPVKAITVRSTRRLLRLVFANPCQDCRAARLADIEHTLTLIRMEVREDLAQAGLRQCLHHNERITRWGVSARCLALEPKWHLCHFDLRDLICVTSQLINFN